MNSRFEARLRRADTRVQRTFAEKVPVVIRPGPGERAVSAIVETPDNPVAVPHGGDIVDLSPALSLLSCDVGDLRKGDVLLVNGEGFRVTHIGANELGRTRITLACGGVQPPPPSITAWSKKRCERND